MSLVLPYAGYLCWYDDLQGQICEPCAPGTYHIITDAQTGGLTTECTPCPPGE